VSAAAGAALRVVVLSVALVLLLAGCATAAPQPPQPAVETPLQRQLVADVSAAGAGAHLEALQRIADENGGNRAAPSPGYEASVDYVGRVLRDAGYDVATPTYPAPIDGVDGEETEVPLRQVVLGWAGR
jgi:aminopeptidase S